jgi:hypothetical protein
MSDRQAAHVVRVKIAPAFFAQAEAEAAHRQVDVATWASEVVETYLVDARVAARDALLLPPPARAKRPEPGGRPERRASRDEDGDDG